MLIAFHRLPISVVAAASAVMLMAGGSQAQDQGPKHLTLLGIPSATTAPKGVVFGQVSQSFDVSSNTEDRTALSFGFGFGDADAGFGGQLTAVGASSTTTYDSFTYFGVKVARRLTSFDDPTYVGLQVNRISPSGHLEDEDPTASLMFTRFGVTQSANGATPYMVTIGAGSNLRNDGEDAGLLLGAGMGISRNLAVSAAWSGEQVDLGASLRFDALQNVRLSFVLSDVVALQDRRQLTVGLSWAFDAGQRR